MRGWKCVGCCRGWLARLLPILPIPPSRRMFGRALCQACKNIWVVAIFLFATAGLSAILSSVTCGVETPLLSPRGPSLTGRRCGDALFLVEHAASAQSGFLTGVAHGPSPLCTHQLSFVPCHCHLGRSFSPTSTESLAMRSLSLSPFPLSPPSPSPPSPPRRPSL